MNEYKLKLFIAGRTPKSVRAISNIRRICNEELEGKAELTIIDILEHPQIAEETKILATPTLLKDLPLPSRRIIGDLSDTEKVLIGLDIKSYSFTYNYGGKTNDNE
ncbi:circadian clock protein kaiB [Candidatus Magnetoovum chiemensis]|nr:circadian clock protein kaiB [Candidatus Magnetoovum chiemensis]